jgi:nucleoid-associated protein YgaU
MIAQRIAWITATAGALALGWLFVRPLCFSRTESTVLEAHSLGTAPAPAVRRRFEPDADTEVVFQIGGIRLPQTPAAAGNASPRQASPAERAGADRRPAPAPLSGGATSPDGAKRYVVGAGDTLSVIAKRLLGSAARWKEIADLNGIDDPARLKAGQELRIP